ncbi:hypothetical protein LAZ67_3001068 [Cordylochernes scorpioides]|uniref:Integrase catalytic domain-containing protein n=1 Tax=Cordylochernes scorpioides TaxID=51811 RepID=A0ABY6KB95_9ARAC|nr:hypothetical protein LAZ67_3001068 [Cordylochernes scorpioides]
MDQETEIRRIKRLGLNLEKLAKEIEENAADCFELDAILKKILKIKQQLEQAYEYFIGIRDTDELLLEIEELTDKYSKLEVKILRFTQHFHNDANLPLSNNAVNKNYANLPKLELPFFDGKLENWISFSNVFKTTIIDNCQLTNIVKLQYLKACLKGKALILVNHIPITENNFVLAWGGGDLLEKRYDNKRDLIFNLIQRIIDLPKITIESSTQLLFLVDNSYEIIRSLETLGYKLDELSDIIIGKILSDKLDKTTKRSWSMTVDNNHIPTCSELLKFIETNARALNTSETERVLPLIKRSMKLQVHNLTKANCFLCQQEHGIYLCPTFLDMEPIERRKKVKQLKLCFNCLRNNYSVNQCRSEFKCRKCQGKHNTLMPTFIGLKNIQTSIDHLQGLQLADPQYQYTAPIGILLGADIAFSLFKGAIKYGHEGQPKAIKTLLGWLLFGEIKTFQKKSRNYQKLHTFNCTLNNWEPIFSLWEEELKTKPDPFEDDFNEIHFKTTHERETSGRYIVRLPFKDPSLLGESKPQAINFILRMEQILKQQPQVYQTYNDFMQEYLVLGHMNEVKGNGNDHKAFYLPHHPIIKEKSSTTKLRVVFNASSKTTTGYSLNNILHTGPKLQKDIFPLLLRFRSHPIAISADITKMYRQILVHPEDTPYQRIIWRDESSQGLKEYELKTLTYGTSCAPFLAIRVLKQLAHDEQIRFPTAEAILKSDFYVDDLLTGCETIEIGRKLIRELDQLLQAGGFKLRQWASNKPTILDTLQETDKSTFYANVDRENTLGVNLLGINWNPRSDEIGLRKLEIIKNTPTKRNILSQMAKIYDPLDWFAPVMLKIKLMIQTLWAAKLTWDEPIPVRLQESWKVLQNDLASLHQVQIPRWIGLFEPATYEIHGFADASQRAYAAMVYIKIIHNSSIHEVYLLAAKTRVATLKTTTTPRMELCASLLLAQLTRLVCTAMSLNVNKVTLWSDSTIDIQELLPCRWMHVKGEDNPADLASRGISLDQLLDLELWWHGPPWLKTTSQPYNDAIQVINDKCLIKQILFKCIKCARFRTKAVQQLMGNLPTSRTNWTRPFTKTGIDFAGPVIVKTSNLRNARCDKAYIALFICMFSKAIHIELVTNLTTEAFLASLRSLIGRRGRPAEINTDNATNFVGAYKDLRKLFNSNIHDFAFSEEIKWNFIPPSSPHFGGLWEAGIKSVKTLVLLKEDNLPPLKWRMGRINQVYPGEDGLVRVVSVKTADGDLRRAVAKVCPLPLDCPTS